MFFGDISARLGLGSTVVDDYEDQDLAEYTDYEANGGITPYTFTTSAYEGSYAVNLTDDGTYPKHISTAGLDYYPERGDEIVFYTYHSSATNTINAGYYYGASDLSNLYYTRLYPSDGQVKLQEKSGGSDTDLVSISASPAPGWLEWTIQWGDGNTFGLQQDEHRLIVERIDDGTVITDATGVATNHVVSGGGVGHWGGVSSGEEMRWDYAGVTNADDVGYTLIEDWEDSSPKSEWEDHSDGSLTQYTVQTSSGSPHGDHYIQNTDNQYWQINSENGQLPYYPQEGDAIEWYAFTGTVHSTFVWAFPDNRDLAYFGRPRVDNQELEIELAGTRYDTAVSVAEDQWYKMRLEWDDGATFGGVAGDQTLIMSDLDGNQLASVTGNDTQVTAPEGVSIGCDEYAGIDFIRKTN